MHPDASTWPAPGSVPPMRSPLTETSPDASAAAFRDRARMGRLCRRGVLHREPVTPHSVKGVAGRRDRTGSRQQSDLADTLRAVRTFWLRFLDKDALDFRHALRRDDALRLQSRGLDVAALDNEFLGERVTK